MMETDPDLIVNIVFTAEARAAIGRKSGPPMTDLAPAFPERAHLVVSGDYLRIEGIQGLFAVSRRVWHAMSDQTTLTLVLDGPVQDGH